MTGMYPYLEAKLNERVLAWGLVGLGRGEITLRRENETLKNDLDLTMGAGGIKGRVLDGSGASGIGLELKSDAMWIRTSTDRTRGMMESEGDVSRVRLRVQGRVRGLVAHEESGYEDWGASGSVRINPEDSGRGLMLSVTPVWGNAGSQAGRLWGARDAEAFGPGGDFVAKARLNTEIGYGAGGPGGIGVVRPYTGLSLAQDTGRICGSERAGTSSKEP